MTAIRPSGSASKASQACRGRRRCVNRCRNGISPAYTRPGSPAAARTATHRQPGMSANTGKRPHAVRARWQPRVRAQARKQAATSTGLVVDTRARFGFTAVPGTTDDARLRHLTLALPPQHAARLFDAQDTGATEQQLRDIAAEGLGEVYFRDGGRRAHGLEVAFTDVEHLEFDL
ncbi:XRE family transcriptional regulator [Streptomyces sp. NWU339]|uniref:telomere-protecting terminal protein Tpg n=1 Tax=Streptomyces sp. NWU339 TaxID=2185284 RepID=UPI0035C7D248